VQEKEPVEEVKKEEVEEVKKEEGGAVEEEEEEEEEEEDGDNYDERVSTLKTLFSSSKTLPTNKLACLSMSSLFNNTY
jgi:hypothetical protein